MTTKLQMMIACTTVCLATGAAFAQAGYGTTPASGSDQNTASREARESQTFFRSKNLVGADVKDSQGQKLGDIYDVLVNPRNGQTFAAISVRHGNYALVPFQALTLMPSTGTFSHKADVTVNTTKESLEQGPTVKSGDWQMLDTPSFTESIYKHYNLQVPAMGGTGANSLGGTSSGSSVPPKKQY